MLRSDVSMVVVVAFGAAVGGAGRYLISGAVARVIGETFPWGTLAVNVLGSLIIGLFAALVAPEGRFLVPSEARQFVMTGIMGGFTTFSSFSLQTLMLMRDGQTAFALANVALSVLCCLLAVWLGDRLGTLFST